LSVWTGSCITTPSARAQDAGRIAAVVNEDAITLLDVFERMNIIIATSGIEVAADTRQRLLPQVLRTLIDEKLQMQEGARAGLDDVILDFQQAYKIVEQNLGLNQGQMLPFFEFNNLSLESLNAQLTAEVIWSELVNQRMRSEEITDEDIEDELDRLRAAVDQPAYLLAEIFLSVDDPSKEPEIEGNMWRLRDAIEAGASFPAIAQQFSQSASRLDGGDIGWIVESQLSEDLLAVVPLLARGQLSEPIRVIGGFAMILMRQVRVGFEASQDDAQLLLRQITFPVEEGEADDAFSQRAVVAASAIGSCDDLDALAEADPTISVGSPIPIQLGALQPIFQDAVAPLAVGEASEPIQTAQGFVVIVVCERGESTTGLPPRDEILRVLESEQFDLISRGYLRDLRRASFVDIRL
ncbi:MAG: hypothetical protein HN768_01100, partial [Rhodospirillaceae bacterium]|nr:hypothetical protein [Rhodospirillaceae bacterium]